MRLKDARQNEASGQTKECGSRSWGQGPGQGPADARKIGNYYCCCCCDHNCYYDYECYYHWVLPLLLFLLLLLLILLPRRVFILLRPALLLIILASIALLITIIVFTTTPSSTSSAETCKSYFFRGPLGQRQLGQDQAPSKLRSASGESAWEKSCQMGRLKKGEASSKLRTASEESARETSCQMGWRIASEEPAGEFGSIRWFANACCRGPRSPTGARGRRFREQWGG